MSWSVVPVCYTIILYVLQTGSAHQVVQLHMINWSPDGSCSHLATITSVINEMSAIQRRTGNHPITVHCRYANTDKWVVC